MPPANPSEVEERPRSSRRPLMLGLSYLGPLALVSFFAGKDDPLVRWHAKQGLLLSGFWILAGFALSVLSAVPTLGCLSLLVSTSVPFVAISIHVVLLGEVTQGKNPEVPGTRRILGPPPGSTAATSAMPRAVPRGNPWENRGSLVDSRALVRTIGSFLLTPRRAFAATRARGDVWGPLAFALVCSVPAILVSLLPPPAMTKLPDALAHSWKARLLAALLLQLAQFAAPFLGLLLTLWPRQRLAWPGSGAEGILSIASYSLVISPILAVGLAVATSAPLLDWIALPYILWLSALWVLGARVLGQADLLRSALATWGGLFFLSVLLGGMLLILEW